MRALTGACWTGHGGSSSRAGPHRRQQVPGSSAHAHAGQAHQGRAGGRAHARAGVQSHKPVNTKQQSVGDLCSCTAVCSSTDLCFIFTGWHGADCAAACAGAPPPACSSCIRGSGWPVRAHHMGRQEAQLVQVRPRNQPGASQSTGSGLWGTSAAVQLGVSFAAVPEPADWLAWGWLQQRHM